MTNIPISSQKGLTRREILRLAVGIGALALPPTQGLAVAEPLLLRPIPRTGERLPAIGLGTSIVLDVGDDRVKRSERRAVIQTMLDGGGRVIDTAPSYGTAERVLGELLSEMKVREKVFVATKVRVAGREAAIAELNESFRRLSVNKIDLMQIHNVSATMPDAAAQIALLREWKAKGVFRYIGVTHYLESANERLIELMPREKLDFVQINYSLAERGVEQRLLAVAAETGTAVLVNRPFARNRVFAAVRGRRVPEWVAELGVTSWGQFFLKYILAHEAVTCVIPGTDKPEYMADNLNAGRGPLPDAAMRKKMVQLWESLA